MSQSPLSIIPPMEHRVDLSHEEFVHSYLLPRKPVLLKGLFRDAPMMSRWTLEFFRERYGQLDVQVASYKVGFTERRTRTLPLHQYLDWIENDSWREHWYEGYPPPYLDKWMEFDALWGKRAHEVAADFTVPDHFTNHARFLPRWLQIPIVRQLFIGPAGTVAWLHQDACKTHFWHVNVTGRKRWVFFAPEQTPNVYSVGGRSLVDADHPDLEKYPLFRCAQPLCEVIQEPGDVVFGPSDFWHQVTSLTPCISLTMNFTDATTTPAYLRDLARQAPLVARDWLRSLIQPLIRPRAA